jgi:hypothetical protein
MLMADTNRTARAGYQLNTGWQRLAQARHADRAFVAAANIHDSDRPFKW